MRARQRYITYGEIRIFISRTPTHARAKREPRGSPESSRTLDGNNDTFAMMKFDTVITPRADLSPSPFLRWIVDIIATFSVAAP